MTIKVTATCAWCTVTKETTVEQPVPEDWVTEKVQNPVLGDETLILENFCCADHKDIYQSVAPECHTAASLDYTAKFFSAMNVKKEACELA